MLISICSPQAGDRKRETHHNTNRRRVTLKMFTGLWAVGAECRVVWSEDGQVYPAVVVSVDGECRRVRFIGYGNEEVMELSALKSCDAEPQAPSSQDWKPGSRCRAVFSEDGLIYPAVVLWVKGQRCRIRFDEYNNEEDQDVNGAEKPTNHSFPFFPPFPPPAPQSGSGVNLTH
uniref:Tudor domain-containing protein n=1 Tax=Amphiprion percula TaxID=161767 RepID=A0A3P8RLT4_AMPPE